MYSDTICNDCEYNYNNSSGTCIAVSEGYKKSCSISTANDITYTNKLSL